MGMNGTEENSLFDGQRTKGQDVRTQNVTAVVSIANIVKSSLGPVGLDKVGQRARWRRRAGPNMSRRARSAHRARLARRGRCSGA